jgi:hypothetical protein
MHVLADAYGHSWAQSGTRAAQFQFTFLKGACAHIVPLRRFGPQRIDLKLNGS